MCPDDELKAVGMVEALRDVSPKGEPRPPSVKMALISVNMARIRVKTAHTEGSSPILDGHLDPTTSDRRLGLHGGSPATVNRDTTGQLLREME